MKTAHRVCFQETRSSRNEEADLVGFFFVWFIPRYDRNPSRRAFRVLRKHENACYPSNALFRFRGEPQHIVAWVQRKTTYRGYPQIKSWKNFTTAEGGASTWLPLEGVNNAEIYKMYQLLSLHGQNKDALAKTKIGAWEYDIIWDGVTFVPMCILAITPVYVTAYLEEKHM